MLNSKYKLHVWGLNINIVWKKTHKQPEAKKKKIKTFKSIQKFYLIYINPPLP